VIEKEIYVYKVGIITYHAAYNYGSVLQAYATQQAISNLLKKDTEIINYRTIEQKRIYSNNTVDIGIKAIIKKFLQLPLRNKLQCRANKFEDFINKYLTLSEEYNTYEELKNNWQQYEVIISGSDQIWNKHSLEMENMSWNELKPYLLYKFAGRKVSYASSVGGMTNEELLQIKNELKDFECIAMREQSSAHKLSRLLGRSINTVLDPTFLLTKEDWKEKLDICTKKEQGYIFYYSLDGVKKIKENEKILRILHKKTGKIIKYITPFCVISLSKDIYLNCLECGPIEFVNIINGADIVFTNSFHGTAFSIIFQKNFWSISSGLIADFRKVDLLNKLDLQQRNITVEQLQEVHLDENIDYSEVEKKLNILRYESLKYLKENICK